MTAVAAKIKTAKPAAKPVRAPRSNTTLSRTIARKYARQRLASYIIGGVFVVGLALSLKHQAAGIAAIIHADAIEGWFMAVLIDAGFIGLELASIFSATPGTAKAVGKYANPAIIATVIASAAMNSVAFMQHAQGPVGIAGAVIAGCFIPGFLLVLTKVGTKLYMTAAR